MSERAQALERSLQTQIPLAGAMRVRVLLVEPDRVVIAAPLAPNVNHHRTFFGGSAATLATLAAWALTEEKLLAEQGLDVHVVIQRSTMEYLEPAAAEVEAECHAPSHEEWDRFIRTIRRRGKARIDLAVELRAEGAHVGSFQGSFVALPVKSIY